MPSTSATADSSDLEPISSTWLATTPASRAERRLALAVVATLLLLFAGTGAWARLPLTPVWAFIPIYEAALVLLDLMTVVLLFGQMRIARSRALLVLACGYLFSALATVAHALSFPGLFAPGGLLGAGPQSTAWIYMFWHGGFPLFVIAYALLRRSRSETLPGSRRFAGLGMAALAIGAAAALTGLATQGHDLLPTIMSGNRYTPVMIGVVSAVWLASPVALAVLLWRQRPPSVLDLWLAVGLAAWSFDIALSAVLNAGRFDLGFYAGRIYGLLAAGIVLARLLLENGVLHTRLIGAHARERRRSAELQRLSQRLQAINAQLGESNRRLEEQSRFKSEFLANMSHELRTPLNAIIGFSEILKEGIGGGVNERQQGYAGHILHSGHHLLSLINDVLDLSKIEAGKVEIALDRVHLPSVLSEALAMVSERARGRGIALELDLRTDAELLGADRRRLKQILLNLASNAIKFSPDGGKVGIGMRTVDRARAETGVPGHPGGLRMPLPPSDFERFLEISVTDTGIGITRSDMRRLFQPFTQLPNAITRRAEGTGLGLVMVQRLAELQGGAVAVSSLPGRGSCFTVWLPWRGHEPAPAPGVPAARAATQRLALVIEDNGEAAALMSAQLEGQGFAVRCVRTAEEALALAPDLTPDLITLDILLPGIDGWEFLARRKEIPGWEAVPVVVVSVVADQGKGYSLGAALMLQKPVAREALAQGLDRLGLKPNGGREVSVLVIDDDARSVELLAAQLRQRKYLVLRAFGGREGIDLARRFQPDLIALDLEMPEVNGFDVVEALKQDPGTAEIPIIVVTARDLGADDRARLNGHILELMGKSDFERDNFAGEVQRALARV